MSKRPRIKKHPILRRPEMSTENYYREHIPNWWDWCEENGLDPEYLDGDEKFLRELAEWEELEEEELRKQEEEYDRKRRYSTTVDEESAIMAALSCGCGDVFGF